jgi:tetratricopeptide (TPR) repeat protein
LDKNIILLSKHLSLTEGDLIDEQHRFSAFKQWLQRHDNWLLILDNLEEVTLIEQIVPFESSGHVLLTTLTKETAHLAHAVPVIEMANEDAALFLLRRAKLIEERASSEVITQAVFAQATSIVKAFGRSFLALDQAGAYIESKQCGLARYLQLYHKEGAKLLAKRGTYHIHKDAIKQTLSLNFKKVDQSHPSALKLLHLLAFLYPSAIPEEMIEQGMGALNPPLKKLAADALALEDVIALFLKYALVQRRIDTRTLSIHRIVQIILKEELTPKQQAQGAMQAVRLISSLFPKPDFNNWPACEKYFSQARDCAELIHKFDLFQKEALHLVIHLAEYCYQRAYYRDAETYLTDALQSCEQTMGPDHLDTAHVLNNLARVYHKLARYQEAEELFRRAETILKQIWGPEHSEIAHVLNNLAYISCQQGQYQRAEELYKRALNIYEKVLGPEYPDAASILDNLGNLYHLMGKDEVAESLLRRGLAIREQALGGEHFDTARSLRALIDLLQEQRRYGEAEPLYRRNLAFRKHSGQKILALLRH